MGALDYHTGENGVTVDTQRDRPGTAVPPGTGAYNVYYVTLGMGVGAPTTFYSANPKGRTPNSAMKLAVVCDATWSNEMPRNRAISSATCFT